MGRANRPGRFHFQLHGPIWLQWLCRGALQLSMQPAFIRAHGIDAPHLGLEMHLEVFIAWLLYGLC